MLFALIDYTRYVRRTGRFSRDPVNGVMAGAFDAELPAAVLDRLQPGDVLFIATFNWPLAWLIMYSTSSQVSHVAWYAGSGRVAHATLSGVRLDNLSSLYSPSSRILACVWPMPEAKRAQVTEVLEQRLLGLPYGWSAVILKAARIATARDWPYFRWNFFADAALLVALLDMPFLFLASKPVLLWLLPAYFSVIVGNALLWRLRPLSLSEETSKPVDLLHMLQAIGGEFMLDAYSLRKWYEGQGAHEPSAGA